MVQLETAVQLQALSAPARPAVACFRDRDRFVVELAGEHDVATIAMIDAATRNVWRAGSTVLVDLTAATFIDSAVVNWLLRAEARLQVAGRSLVIIAGPSGSFAARVLDRTGTRDAFRRSTRARWTAVAG